MGRIVEMSLSMATGASYTSHVNLGEGEFNRFALIFPSTNPLAAAADINAQLSDDGGTTWYTIGYSNNPSTATSGFKAWDCGQASWGKAVMCEAAIFARDFRLTFGSAATTAATIKVILGKD